MRVKLFLIVSLMLSTHVLAGWYDTPNQSEGFYFYGPNQPIKPKPKKPVRLLQSQKKPVTPYPYTQQLKKMRAELEERLSQAILLPTSPNLYAYQVAQQAVLARAEYFSLGWLYNLYRYPELDHTLRAPVNQLARETYYKKRQYQRVERIQSLSKEYGLFFFFSQDCRYCTEMAPIVKRFAEKYAWQVLAIRLGEGNLSEFPKVEPDNGLAAQWGVEVTPALFAVNPRTKHILPLAYGLTALEEIERRAMTLMQKVGA